MVQKMQCLHPGKSGMINQHSNNELYTLTALLFCFQCPSCGQNPGNWEDEKYVLYFFGSGWHPILKVNPHPDSDQLYPFQLLTLFSSSSMSENPSNDVTDESIAGSKMERNLTLCHKVVIQYDPVE